ncbi:hypothetical protein AB8B22_09665 [Leptotrichia sp. HSP-334]|uniref:Uncharacterized protein n=1 Tax=Leptotrichia rugosa TaxID=3239302 RepID=A0AB39VGJ7_9FUSO
MKRYLNGILFAGLSSIIAAMICLGFSMIFLGYKIISIIIFFIVFFGWIFGIKIKKTETESKNIVEPIRQSKFGANAKNENLLNPKYETLPMRDITKGIPVITIFSIITVYFIDVILVAYYLKREQKLPFPEGLSYSWMEVFKISNEIYTDWAWIILVAIVSVVAFIKAEKKEQMSKEN